MAGRVTSADKTRMRKLAAQGLSEREIALKVGRSRDTVSRCLTGPKPRNGVARAPGHGQTAEMPTRALEARRDGTEGQDTPVAADIEEQRGMLSSMLRVAMDAAKRATAEGNDTLALSYGRQGAALAAALRRLNPREQDEETEFVKVRITDMDAAALRGRERLQEQLSKLLEKRAAWPRCSECGQPVEPKSKEENREQTGAEQAAEQSGAGAGTGAGGEGGA